MYWIIIGVIVAVIIVFSMALIDDFTFGYLASGVLIGCTIAYLGVSLCSTYLPDNPANCEYEITRVELVALNDTTELSRQIYVGSGQLSNKAVYYYLSGNEDDGFQQFRVNAEDCYIKYTNSDHYVEINAARCKTNIEPWTFPVLFNILAPSTYTFYVPEGSITY